MAWEITHRVRIVNNDLIVERLVPDAQLAPEPAPEPPAPVPEPAPEPPTPPAPIPEPAPSPIEPPAPVTPEPAPSVPEPIPDPPAPAPVPSDVLWLVDADPARPFGVPQGAIPLGNGQASGQPNLLVGVVERQYTQAGVDEAVQQIRLDQADPRVSPTEIRHTPGVAWIARVPDPTGSGSMVYRHQVNRAAVGFKPGGGDSFRSEIGGTGDWRFAPWGTEEICCAAVYLPPVWASFPATGWHVLFQWHDATGGLTGNPPFAVYYTPGGGFGCTLRRYKAGLVPPASGNEIAARESIAAATGRWHWFVAHYSADAGPGFSGATPGFFDLYRAEGDGALEPVFAYRGRWGSPNPSDRGKPGFWKDGLYLKTDFAGNDDRIVYTRGFRQYVVGRTPELTPAAALADFRAAR